MTDQPKFTCPECGTAMEPMGETPSDLRVCPACGLLQWEGGGKTETRHGERVRDEDLPEELREKKH